jgi:hypothetical protein
MRGSLQPELPKQTDYYHHQQPQLAKHAISDTRLNSDDAIISDKVRTQLVKCSKRVTASDDELLFVVELWVAHV